MERIKQFLIYILIIIGAYVLFSFFAYGFITKTYKDIKEYEILEQTPVVQVLESKTTYVNGYVIGQVTNNTDALIHSEYIKFNFYNERDTYLGSRYVKLESFQVGQTLEFKVNYKLTAVDKFTVEFTDEEGIQHSEEDKAPFYHFLGLAGAIIIISYIF